MAARLLALILVLVGGSVTVWAQMPGSANLRVQVVTDDGRPAALHLRVELVTSGEAYVSSALTDEEGRAEFSARPGSYRLRVTGAEINEALSPAFTIFAGDAAALQDVRVSLKGTSMPEVNTSAPTISQASLSIPAGAKKEYNKGGKAMQDGNWSEARRRLEKAVLLYPQFAIAYNDLGVVFMNTGEKQKGRAAFERAVAIDPNYGRPYRNLAILTLSEGKPAEARPLAEKALASDPFDPQVLLLLAQICLQTGSMEEAAKHARKVHDVPHQGFGAAHLIAARALETQNLASEAASEYRMFLKESPNSVLAPKVRAALKRLTETVTANAK